MQLIEVAVVLALGLALVLLAAFTVLHGSRSIEFDLSQAVDIAEGVRRS